MSAQKSSRCPRASGQCLWRWSAFGRRADVESKITARSSPLRSGPKSSLRDYAPSALAAAGNSVLKNKFLTFVFQVATASAQRSYCIEKYSTECAYSFVCEGRLSMLHFWPICTPQNTCDWPNGDRKKNRHKIFARVKKIKTFAISRVEIRREAGTPVIWSWRAIRSCYLDRSVVKYLYHYY